MSNNASIFNQHQENTEWMNKLSFYKDEIRIFTTRLEEIVSKNSDKETLAQAERFQNQWIIQRNNIDEILHKVKENEQSLVAEINRNPVAVDHRKMEYHAQEKELVEGFENNFNSIRDEFNRFSAKWM